MIIFKFELFIRGCIIESEGKMKDHQFNHFIQVIQPLSMVFFSCD